ncbi:hypothetical protein LCGC14_1295460 [marine sediment metagenome]|uniref:Uncharacterized protein n=1 Tax=marine sediment metagenome TaxID=412755 RepID=A0A0F9N7R2_9ZZZZ
MATKSKKELKQQLQEEKRQRKYAERDAKMWCDVVLEQEDDLQCKDVIIAGYMRDVRKLKKKLTAIRDDDNANLATRIEASELGDEILVKTKVKVKAWHNGEPMAIGVVQSE